MYFLRTILREPEILSRVGQAKVLIEYLNPKVFSTF